MYRQFYLVKEGTHNDTWIVGGVDYQEKFKSFCSTANKIFQSNRNAEKNSLEMLKTLKSEDAAEKTPKLSQKQQEMAIETGDKAKADF
jgi:hypothetical protein